jgi:hypothetical protein
MTARFVWSALGWMWTRVLAGIVSPRRVQLASKVLMLDVSRVKATVAL